MSLLGAWECVWYSVVRGCTVIVGGRDCVCWCYSVWLLFCKSLVFYFSVLFAVGMVNLLFLFRNKAVCNIRRETSSPCNSFILCIPEF